MARRWTILLLMIFAGPVLDSAAGESGTADTGVPAEPDRPESHRFRLTPYAGILMYGGLEPLPNTGFLGDLPRPSSVLIGVRLSRLMTRYLVVEATFTRSTTENVHELLYVDPDPLEENPPFGVQSLRNSIDPVLRLGGDVMFVLPLRGSIEPHLTAGLGWVHHSAREEVAASVVVPLSDGTVFADTIGVPESNVKIGNQDWLSIDLGGGMSGDLTQTLAVRMDVVFHISKFSQLDVEGPLSGDVFYARPRWVNDLEVSSGVMFKF